MNFWFLVRRGYSVLLATLVLFAGLPAAAESYRLAPGDIVRAQITGIGGSSYSARVDMDGSIRFPFLGTHDAEGSTLGELLNDISVETAGRQIELSSSTGETRVLVLDRDDIFLDIEKYRPVTVMGAVETPGRVDFEPGMTVRSAIGMSGGFLVARYDDNETFLPNLRIRYEGIRQREAWLAADLWRIDLLLSGADLDDEIPAEFASLLESELSETDLKAIRDRIRGDMEQLQRDRDDLDARVSLAQSQVELLRIAMGQYKTASDSEEARLANILALSDRGLATANILEGIRASALNTSARLLSTRADLAETERELQSLEADRLELDAKFQQDLLEEKSNVEQDYAETQAQSEAIKSELEFGTISTSAQQETAPKYQVVLYRREDGQDTSSVVAFGASVYPGDVIEVLYAEE